MGHAAYLLQCPQHGLLFVDAAHAHVHVQDLRAALLLLLRELHHLIEIPLPQLGLQQLFPGGIDALPHDQEAALQTEGHRTTLRGQVSDALSPAGPFGDGAFPEAVAKLPYVLRRSPAASPQDGSPGLGQKLHLLREGVRVHVIIGTPSLQMGQARIGLGDDGNPCAGSHVCDHLLHLGRACGAVGPHSSGAQGFQHDGSGHGIRSEQSPPLRLKSHGHHYRQVADLLCRDQRRPGLRQAHHGLHHQEVCPCVRQSPDLLLIDIYQLFQLHIPHRGQLPPCHGQVSGQVHRPVRLRSRLPGNGHQASHHLLQPPCQPVVRQLYPVGRKGGHIQDVRTGRHILPLELQHHMGMLQDPLLRTDAGGHARPDQVGACGPVQI